MIIDPKSQYLFKQVGAKRWISRKRGPRESALLPLTYDDAPTQTFDPSRYAYALDKNVLELTETLNRRFNDEFPKDSREDGFAGPTAVPGNFNGLRNVSGVGMDPLPLPLMDNAKYVESLDLANDIDSRDIPYLKELIRLFFGHVVPTPLHIRKAASTSFPYFTTDNQYKKLATIKCLHNIDDFLKSTTTTPDELKRALEEYHTIMLNAIHERHQPNTILEEDGDYKAKPRVAPSEAESRAGLSGTQNADMTVRDRNGNTVKGHFAMRRRPVWGFSGIPNYVFAAIMGCVRGVYLYRFASTYKTRGYEDKEEKISQYKYVVGSDVKSMDTTMPRWFFDFLYKELDNYWDERLIILLKRMMSSSFVAPEPWLKTPESYNPVFGPDPLSGEADLSPGLPSGIFINPDLGKLWMTFVYIILYRDSGALHSPSDIEPFLRGKNPDHGLLDMGDDATMMTNSQTVADKLRNGKSKYAVLEVESPVIFLGDVFAMEGGQKKVYPNPLTYIVNALARESSIERMHPIAYSEGVLARYQQYARTPIFRDMNAIYEEECRRSLGVNPYLIARAVAKRQKFGEIDAMVTANPQYLHYRVDPADVSKEVLDEIVATIPASDFFNSIRHLFKVPTLDSEEITT